MRLRADSEADLERFIRRVAESDEVWALKGPDGMTVCESLEFGTDEDPATVMLFFSDEAYARRVLASHFPGQAPHRIALFDFMYRWLPGMSGDGVVAGPNWSADLTGREEEPFELRERIEAAMTPEHLKAHEERFRELSAREG